MKGRCRTCTHPEAQAIDIALLSAKIPQKDIAIQYGISYESILAHKRKHLPARLQSIVAARTGSSAKEDAALLELALARQHDRLRQMNDRWQKCQQIIEERGRSPEMRDIPGGKTGLLIRRVKQIGSRETAREVEEYFIDRDLLEQMRQLEEHSSKELAQWVGPVRLSEGAARARGRTTIGQVVVISPGQGDGTQGSPATVDIQVAGQPRPALAIPAEVIDVAVINRTGEEKS